MQSHKAGERRAQWLEMLWQLRYSNPKTTPRIADGNCQAMFDYLLQREWPGPGNAPKCRWDTHQLSTRDVSVFDLIDAMPEWAKETHRKPKSMDNHPIFYLHGRKLIYLDGRRRINAYKAQGQRVITVWVIRP